MRGGRWAGDGPFKGFAGEVEEVAAIVFMDVLVLVVVAAVAVVTVATVGRAVKGSTLWRRRRQPRRVARAVTGPPLAQPPERT
jgi:hypothetical protein